MRPCTCPEWQPRIVTQQQEDLLALLHKLLRHNNPHFMNIKDVHSAIQQAMNNFGQSDQMFLDKATIEALTGVTDTLHEFIEAPEDD